MSRMFLIDGRPLKTWNIFTGCRFECSYCSARNLALTRLKHTEKYRQGFAPTFHRRLLSRCFRPGEFVFVAYMGDIAFASRETVINILERVREFPETRFLFCTKHPLIYWFWELQWPANVYLGATIETTEDWAVSKAPIPSYRYQAMRAAALNGTKKFISIEPVMDFDLELMLRWMREIRPDIIEVGADNYNNNLAEPSAAKLRGLLEGLPKICPQVVEKAGLERLKRRDQIGYMKL